MAAHRNHRFAAAQEGWPWRAFIALPSSQLVWVSVPTGGVGKGLSPAGFFAGKWKQVLKKSLLGTFFAVFFQSFT